jgi:hypothetical protein
MCGDKSLRLLHRFEPPHPAFPNPGRFVRLFSTVIGVLIRDMYRIRRYLAMCDRIAT